MQSAKALQPPRRGVLHQYAAKLTAFEHTPPGSNESAQNIIIWIGGLFDGFMTVKYPSSISDALIPTNWTLAQVLLSSSYTGWGTSSLLKDAQELAKCIRYFRTIKKGKIVLMGHSTGCQDVMEYLTGPHNASRPPIDGGILQASVSDREAFSFTMPTSVYQESVSAAQALVSAGKPESILPISDPTFLSAPITARRWLSLASPKHDGDDDYFSSDLTDEQLKKTFGSLPKKTKIAILFSGADEFVPPLVDKGALVKRWIGIVQEGGGVVDESVSGVVEGAGHNLNGNQEGVVRDLVGRVVRFLEGLNELSFL